MKKKVLICGASGFIGRNLFEALSARPDLEVHGTYLNSKTFYKPEFSDHLHLANLTDKVWAKIVTERMDVVINAAALTAGLGGLDPAEYIPSNDRINTNLIEAAHKNKVGQFIFLSCSILYPEHNSSSVKESDTDFARIHPKYRTWAYVKIFGEELCRFYAGIGNTRFTVIRHSNVYGSYDKFDIRGHVFAATVAKIMNAQDSEDITVWGNGQEKRDLIHVSGLVRFVELALDYGNRYDVFNIGSGRSVTVQELVEKINSISGKNLPIHYDVSKPTVDTDIVLDTAKAKEIFGWRPKVDLDEGIKHTIQWYLENHQKGGQNDRYVR